MVHSHCQDVRVANPYDDDLSMLQGFNLIQESDSAKRMAESLQRYWDLVSMAGVQGVLGDRGKGWGHDFKSVGRQIAGD